MDPVEVEMWSDPVSIWTLLEDRRDLFLRAMKAENLLEALRTTVLRLELEKTMMRRKLGYGKAD
jgi:hypothetical protein